MKKLGSVHVDGRVDNPEVVFDAVKRAMELAGWERYVTGKKLVLKINALWEKVYPGCTTTPMVIEGLLKVVLEKKFKPDNVVILDTNTPSVNADYSFRIQGTKALAERYGVEIVNLSDTEFKVVKFKGLVLNGLKISKLLLEADSIITMPVLKTHSYSVMTGALKNQWGCIHDMRHNFHKVIHRAIVDVNVYFRDKVKFAVMDALFGMEGNGPKTGIPRKVGFVFASADLVGMDALAARVMGLDPTSIGHIAMSEKAGVGRMETKIVGDSPRFYKFKPAQKSNLVMTVEMFLRRRFPFLEKILFGDKSPFLYILSRTATVYYDIWFLVNGRKYVNAMMRTNYGRMWKKYYLS